MKTMIRKQHLLENLIYLLIWLVVLIVPIFGFRPDGISLEEHTLHYWSKILPFFILFLINNYALVPYFLLKNKKAVYFILLAATLFLLFSLKPVLMGENKLPKLPAIEQPMGELPPGMIDGEGPMSPPHPDMMHGEGPMPLPPHKVDLPPRHDGGPLIHLPVLIGPMLNNWLVAILIVGFNLAIRFLFKSMRDERQLKELESHTLQTELNYLKAQINPHFFMNTLNNIHALIDIDKDKAKETVIELSKIMRYVLYEAEQQFVPLNKEIGFLENYTALMRIRYTDNVDISTWFPEAIPDVQIPPLLLVTLLENAFKHGISYKQESYIHTRLTAENGRLVYYVENSVFSNVTTPHNPGVGLENMRKRLSLLFGQDYSLKITCDEHTYTAILNIPI